MFFVENLSIVLCWHAANTSPTSISFRTAGFKLFCCSLEKRCHSIAQIALVGHFIIEEVFSFFHILSDFRIESS
jgi:hypothetical protein